MSGDLTRIEPPEKVIELRTMRLDGSRLEPYLAFTAADETRARALIADAERSALRDERPFRIHVLRTARREKTLDLIIALSGQPSHASEMEAGAVIDIHRKWETLLAAILAEKIAGMGEGK